MDTNFLDGAFDSMLLNPQIVSPDDFDNDLSTGEAEDTLTAPDVDDTRLKECICHVCVGMGHPDDVSHTARGVLSSAPSPSPESSHCCPSDGGGKTYILRTLDVIERGITSIFIPLLTLSADVMHKFEHAATTWGNVGVYHLDKLFDLNRLVMFVDGTKHDMLTVHVLASPVLINHRDALDVFISCAHECTL